MARLRRPRLRRRVAAECLRGHHRPYRAGPVRAAGHRQGERDGRDTSRPDRLRRRSELRDPLPAPVSGAAAYAGQAMSDDVKILDGNTFVVSDSRGDIEASPTDPTGLFSFDTRFLSRWVLTIDGERLSALSVDDLHYFEARFFLVPGTGTVYVDAKLSVIRRRSVGDGFHERLTLLNHDAEAVDVAVRIEAGSDFADLFEVKDAL